MDAQFLLIKYKFRLCLFEIQILIVSIIFQAKLSKFYWFQCFFLVLSILYSVPLYSTSTEAPFSHRKHCS